MPLPTKIYILFTNHKDSTLMDVLQKYGSLRRFIADSYSPTTQQAVDSALL